VFLLTVFPSFFLSLSLSLSLSFSLLFSSELSRTVKLAIYAREKNRDISMTKNPSARRARNSPGICFHIANIAKIRREEF